MASNEQPTLSEFGAASSTVSGPSGPPADAGEESGGMAAVGDGARYGRRATAHDEEGAGGAADCQRCGAHVSERFRAVFGDDTDTVHACPDCTEQQAILNGATADPEFDGAGRAAEHIQTGATEVGRR
jgi:hypothetical protein